MEAADFFAVIFCWMLALVFADAARHKVTAGQRFRASLQAYEIIPASLVGMTAAVLAAVELLIAVGLVVLLPAAAVAAAGLLGVYLVAIAVNLARGRWQIDCGCGDEPTPLSFRLVIRNGILIGMALFAGASGASVSELGWQGGLLAVVPAVVGFGIYLVAEQLIANRGRHRRLWIGV